MKITITVEFDQELAQIILNSSKNISQMIASQVNPIEEQDQEIETVLENSDDQSNEIEADPVQEPAVQETIDEQPVQEVVENIAPKMNIRETILNAIKSKKSGMKSKDIQKLSGVTAKQVSNNVAHLKREKLVRKTPKGFFVYIPQKKTIVKPDSNIETEAPMP